MNAFKSLSLINVHELLAKWGAESTWLRLLHHSEKTYVVNSCSCSCSYTVAIFL